MQERKRIHMFNHVYAPNAQSVCAMTVASIVKHFISRISFILARIHWLTHARNDLNTLKRLKRSWGSRGQQSRSKVSLLKMYLIYYVTYLFYKTFYLSPLTLYNDFSSTSNSMPASIHKTSSSQVRWYMPIISAFKKWRTHGLYI